MFSDLTLIDSPNFWDMVEKSQPKVSRQFEDEEKRGPKHCAKASSGNYEEEPTSEAITKKQRKTRSDKKYKNEEEKREACKEINREICKEDWCGKFHL